MKTRITTGHEKDDQKAEKGFKKNEGVTLQERHTATPEEGSQRGAGSPGSDEIAELTGGVIATGSGVVDVLPREQHTDTTGCSGANMDRRTTRSSQQKSSNTECNKAFPEA